ncbi:MAG: nickel-responsive transcriptional regulator NikR [Rhizomicrobium sp.]
MQRITIAIDDALAAEIDALIETRGYQNRSEALRDLARNGLRQIQEDREEGNESCIAALMYVYDHDARDLSKRLTRIFHDHHDLSVAAMHVHLDHGACLELNVLRGSADAVKHLGDHVIAERGVRYGRTFTVPAEISDGRGKRQSAGHGHGHSHARVRRKG